MEPCYCFTTSKKEETCNMRPFPIDLIASNIIRSGAAISYSTVSSPDPHGASRRSDAARSQSGGQSQQKAKVSRHRLVGCPNHPPNNTRQCVLPVGVCQQRDQGTVQPPPQILLPGPSTPGLPVDDARRLLPLPNQGLGPAGRQTDGAPPSQQEELVLDTFCSSVPSFVLHE